MLTLAVLFGSAVLALSPTTASGLDLGPCAGSPPTSAATIRGPVLHVLDGVTLCVALGATPDSWVPLELAGAQSRSAAPGTLMAVAFAQMVTCDVTGTRRGRTIAACRIDDTLVSERILDPEAIQLGLSWR